MGPLFPEALNNVLDEVKPVSVPDSFNNGPCGTSGEALPSRRSFGQR